MNEDEISGKVAVGTDRRDALPPGVPGADEVIGYRLRHRRGGHKQDAVLVADREAVRDEAGPGDGAVAGIGLLHGRGDGNESECREEEREGRQDDAEQ